MIFLFKMPQSNSSPNTVPTEKVLLILASKGHPNSTISHYNENGISIKP